MCEGGESPVGFQEPLLVRQRKGLFVLVGLFCVNLLCSQVLKDVSRCRLFLVGHRPLISAVFPAEVEWCLFFRLNKEEFMGM